jgi:transposase
MAALSELRRKLVDARKSLGQKLNSTLKIYFPLMQKRFAGKLTTTLPLKMLKRWSDLATMKRVKPSTFKKFLSEQGMKNGEKQTELFNAIRSATPLTQDKAIIEPNAIYVVAIVNQILELNKAIGQFDEQISEAVAKHPDEKIFRSLPGAGDALVPRLIAAMGSDRERYADATEVQSYTGIAPVTRSSGKYHSVRKRHACNKFLRQTFHEFAAHSRQWSDWAGAYYRMQMSKGKKHNAAVRALAYKWIRIIFYLWKNEKIYDEQHYITQLKAKNSPIIKFLETP